MGNTNYTSNNNPGTSGILTYPTSYFYVKIDNMSIVFKEVSGLQIETEVFEYREGGVNDHMHRLPGPSKSGNVVLKRGIVATQDFMNWYEKIVNGNIEYQHVDIGLYQIGNDSPIVTWNLADAWPCKWSGPNFVAGDNVVAIETLELAHAGLTLGKK
jgi:phage tail-like protein